MKIITDMPQIKFLIDITQDNPSFAPDEIINEWISRLDEADYSEENEEEKQNES